MDNMGSTMPCFIVWKLLEITETVESEVFEKPARWIINHIVFVTLFVNP